MQEPEIEPPERSGNWQSEQSLSLFKEVVENSSEGIALTDMDGNIRFMNKACADMHGYALDELIGRHVSTVHTPEQLEIEVFPAIERVKVTESEFGEIGHRRKDGSTFPTQMTASIVKDADGTPVGLLTATRDITEVVLRREAERFDNRFRKMVAEISARFVRVNDSRSFDEAVDGALAGIGELFDVDRSYLVCFSDDLSTMDNTHEWCAEGFPAQKHRIQQFPVDTIFWWMELMQKGTPVHIPDVAVLVDGPEKEELQAQGILSLICLPIFDAVGKLIAFMGFDAVRAPCTWPEEQIAMLQVLAEIIGSAIVRLDTMHQLRQSEERYRSFISQISDGVYRLELAEPMPLDLPVEEQIDFLYEHTRLAECNPAFLAMYQVDDRNKVIGKPLVHFHGSKDNPANRASQREFLTSGYKTENQLTEEFDATGERKYFNNNVLGIIENGHLVRLWGTQADVTERQRAEEALREANRQLKRSSQQAVVLAERAEAASVAKSQFLANMSHELRTPMNAVLGFTQLMEHTELDAKQQRYLHQIQIGGKRLLELINDVLDISNIETGKMRVVCESFNVRSLIEDFVSLVAVQAHAKQLELVCFVEPDVPAELRGDARRIRQILSNLIENAIKFTDRGEVVVRVSRVPSASREDEERTCTLRISIRDTGTGIPSDKMGMLFQSFSQVDGSATRRHGGAGVGLAISRELTLLMGGDITVSSQDGQGSEFVVTLPLEIRQGVPSLPAALRGVRVLVVEDNEACRQALCATLESWGMLTDVAVERGEALAILKAAHQREDPIRIVLCDATPSGDPDVALARDIRSDARNSDLSLVLMTSYGEQENSPQADGKELFNAYLAKPVHSQELQQGLAMLLGRDEGSRSMDDPHVPRAGKKGRVLIVEDDETNQFAAQLILEELGHEVGVVNNGQEALAELAATPYDLVLMDIQMPVMDGLEATRKIRDIEAHPGIGTLAPGVPPRLPVIALTALAMPGDRERCLAADMDDYLTKPLDADELTAVLDKWLPAVL